MYLTHFIPCESSYCLFEQALPLWKCSVVWDGFMGQDPWQTLSLTEGVLQRGEFLPEAVWPGGSSSRQDAEPEPGGAEEQEEGRAETDWFPWGEVRDNRSQPSRESSPVRESETAGEDEAKPEGQGVTVKIRLLAEGEQADAFG